jgi:rare lipoprotein A
MLMCLAAAFCGAAVLLVHSSDVTPAKAGGHPHRASHRVSTDGTRRRIPVAIGAAVEGGASMYNPYRSGEQEGGRDIASGEPYDPDAWTAAIQTKLRGKFGGVRFGKAYRLSFALVESADRKVIVKINDVGPLEPGRVIDLNEQAMRYFDPTLQVGLINRVRVTPLKGDDWTAGHVAVREQREGYQSPQWQVSHRADQ